MFARVALDNIFIVASFWRYLVALFDALLCLFLYACFSVNVCFCPPWLHLNFTHYQYLTKHLKNSSRFFKSFCNDLKASQFRDINNTHTNTL